MRILYLNHNVAGTGTYQRVYNFGRSLSQRGHEVVVVTTSRDRRLRPSRRAEGPLTVLEMPDLLWGPGRTGWDPWNAGWRMALLRNRPFDLIHAFDCRPAVILPALYLQRQSGAALFIDWADWWGHGGRIHDRSGWLVRTAFGPIETWFEEAFRLRAVGTTVISTALAARSQALGVDPGGILRISDGCRTEPAPLDRDRCRALRGVDAAEPLIAYVGTATPGEMRLACDMLRCLRASGSAARLVFVGDPKVPLPGDLEASGAALRTGFLPAEELRVWVGAADLCLIALTDTLGNRGRWPGKISEYLSAGRPVLMPHVGDAAELVLRTGAGWTAAPQAEPLAAVAARVLADPAGLREAGARARKVAEGELAWSRLAGMLEEFYLQRVQRRARAPGERPLAVRAGGR